MKLDPKKDPARHCLKLAAWPESDRQAWAAANQAGDILDPGGVASRWAPGTEKKVRVAYGRWLSWLDRDGIVDASAGPGGRASPQNVASYIRHLQSVNAPYTVLGRVRDLHHALNAINPEVDWSWVQRIAKRLRKTVTSSRNKRALLIPSAELFAHGLELMATADRSGDDHFLGRANEYRNGLILALVTARPLRRRNFAALIIGTSFVRRPDGYWLCIGAAETKTGKPIEVPVPVVLTSYVDRYLAHYRPILARRPGHWSRGDLQIDSALWISDCRSVMSDEAIYHMVRKLTGTKFGRQLTPHLFRDCAATSIAIEDPEHVYTTLSVLGHTSLATSEQHYNHAQSLEAAGRMQKLILELRKSGPDTARRQPEAA